MVVKALRMSFAVLGLGLLACLATKPVSAAVIIDTSVGTAAPPSVLGGFTMSPFAQNVSNASGVTSVTSGGLTVGFNQGVQQTSIGNGWGTWSHGYTGSVWHTAVSSNKLSLTVSLPVGTKAFYFYAEPNDTQTTHDITLTYAGATGSPATLSIAGNAGAKFFGIYSTAGEDLTNFTVTALAPSLGFAVGEFGIYNGPSSVVPEPTSMAIFGLSGIAFLARRRAASKNR
jgi:hypothetical protein